MSIESYVLKLQQEKNPGIIEKLVLEFLSGLSWLYGKGVNKRRIKAQKQAVKVSVPVISVGNITAGGTGKTPCIMKLVQILKQMGKHPAILTRGYRGKLEKVGGIVSDWDKILLSAQLAGDEPYMMAMKISHTPVLVGKHRTASAQNAINMGADILLLDDGFQYWKLKRDIDIVLIDCTNPFGGEHLLPRGLLRENLECMQRADIFILTKTEQVNSQIKDKIISRIKQWNDQAFIIKSEQKPAGVVTYENWKKNIPIFLENIENRKAFLVSGIGNPSSFQTTSEMAGFIITGSINFPDRHCYVNTDIEKVTQMAIDSGADIILTTEKDAVKLMPISSIPLYILKIEMNFSGCGETVIKNLITSLK